MTTRLQSFEGITPSGTTVSTANSGVGTDRAFDAVSIGATSTLTSSSANPAHGSLGCLISASSVESAYMQWDTSLGTTTQFWTRFYCYFPALPTGAVRLFQALNAGAAAASVQMGTSGKLSIIDASNLTTNTGTQVIAIAQQIRIEIMMTISATVGQVEVKLYHSADSSSVTATLTSAATLNLGPQATQYRYGRASSSTAATGTFYMDDFELNDVGYPGPLAVASGTGASIQMATIRRANPMMRIREANR